MQELCWFLRYFAKQDEHLSETPLIRLQSRTPEKPQDIVVFLFLHQYIDFELRGKSKNY